MPFCNWHWLVGDGMSCNVAMRYFRSILELLCRSEWLGKQLRRQVQAAFQKNPARFSSLFWFSWFSADVFFHHRSHCIASKAWWNEMTQMTTYGWPPFERLYQWDDRQASQVQQMCSQHSTLRFDASRAVPKKAGVIGVLTPTTSRKERIWIAYNGQSMSILLKWMIWGTSILGNHFKVFFHC